MSKVYLKRVKESEIVPGSRCYDKNRNECYYYMKPYPCPEDRFNECIDKDIVFIETEGPSITTWEHYKDPDGTAYDWFRCSKCRQIAPGNYLEMDKCNYCPNCGLKIKK